MAASVLLFSVHLLMSVVYCLFPFSSITPNRDISRYYDFPFSYSTITSLRGGNALKITFFASSADPGSSIDAIEIYGLPRTYVEASKRLAQATRYLEPQFSALSGSSSSHLNDAVDSFQSFMKNLTSALADEVSSLLATDFLSPCDSIVFPSPSRRLP